MNYSFICILAFVHHIILNYEAFRNGKKEASSDSHFRYRQYLCALFVFYLSDLLWGFFEESGNYVLIYANTMLFFATMAFSVLLWTRYVVAFLDRHGIKAKLFLTGGWVIFFFVIFHLIVNIFNPTIFTFTDDVKYVPELGRNILMGAQILMFLAISVYSVVVAISLKGRDKVHYMAVGLSGGVMAVFTVLQTFDAFYPYYTIGCFIANTLIHVFVEEDEKKEQDRITADAQKEKEIYSQVSVSLAAGYEAIYYIDIETGKYMEISTSDTYKSMNVPKKGEDFYKETRENVAMYAHPDDRAFAESMYYKDTMLKKLKDHKSYSYRYRIMVGDEARYYRFDVMLSEDGKHIVLCDKDIQDMITAETSMLEEKKASITFTQIAESLASNYDVIYYVDPETGEYTGFTAHNIYGEFEVNESGDDFFVESKRNIGRIIHPDDKERMFEALDRDYLLTMLETRKQFDMKYRHVLNGKVQHTAFSARKSTDRKHIIISVENIDDEVRREKEHLRALNTANELARRDELTGIKNKTAFTELEQSIQESINNGTENMPFALAVCDLNDLKMINDTEGHMAGDDYLRSSAKLLCDIFSHSPVFRIGGDEFAVYLIGDDYTARERLVKKLHEIVLKNNEEHKGPVIAVGVADYDPSLDSDVNRIFERADQEMYEDKRELKKEKTTQKAGQT